MTAALVLTALTALTALLRANQAHRHTRRIEQFLTNELLDDVDAFGWDDDTDTIPDWLHPPRDDE